MEYGICVVILCENNILFCDDRKISFVINDRIEL